MYMDSLMLEFRFVKYNDNKLKNTLVQLYQSNEPSKTISKKDVPMITSPQMILAWTLLGVLLAWMLFSAVLAFRPRGKRDTTALPTPSGVFSTSVPHTPFR